MSTTAYKTLNTYTADDVLRLGARYHNTKRNYLLINPLQGKHIPTSPTECITMFRTLGEQLKEKYPDTNLVIGFAETATAVGAGIASVFGCNYICTTRENYPGHNKIEFLEEHSHAAEQILLTDNLEDYISQTNTIIFVDDELSTGKTMCNIMKQLMSCYPELREKKIVVASLINRVSEENIRKMANIGITCESLVYIPNTDYTAEANKMLPHIRGAEIATKPRDCTIQLNEMTAPLNKQMSPRTGVNITLYKYACVRIARSVYENNRDLLEKSDHIEVIGTEECMYPAILLGKYLENNGLSVVTHSTTRSPIGIAPDLKNYPITNGYALPSFYDDARQTFIYNMTKHKSTDVSTVILVTDANNAVSESAAFTAFMDLMAETNTTHIITVSASNETCE